MAVFVIPAFNEEANVPRLLADLESRPDLWRDGGWVILADDGSTDDTVEAARAHDGDLPVEVLVAERNGGPGKAFDRGFRRALAFCPRGRADRHARVRHDERPRRAGGHAGRRARGRRRRARLASRQRRARERVRPPPLPVAGRLVGDPPRRRAGRQHRLVVLPRLPRRRCCTAATRPTATMFIRERGFACKAEILMKLSRLGITIAEVPVILDWSQARGREQDEGAPDHGRLRAADGAPGRSRGPARERDRHRRRRPPRARPRRQAAAAGVQA